MFEVPPNKFVSFVIKKVSAKPTPKVKPNSFKILVFSLLPLPELHTPQIGMEYCLAQNYKALFHNPDIELLQQLDYDCNNSFFR